MRENSKFIGVAVLFIMLAIVFIGYSTTAQSPADSVNPAKQSFIAANANFSTYLGGTGAEDATKVAFDSEGNTILIGQTASDDFPVTDSAVQRTYGGGDWDAFVAKFDVEGNLVFLTYLGGNGYEHVTSVNTDALGNIIVAGNTASTDFPTNGSAYQPTKSSIGDGFVTKLSADGSTILFSTYFGGDGEDWIYGMEFDESGNLMFAGWSTSSDLATTGAYQESSGGSADAFVAKLSANGQTKIMCSYFGGSAIDRAWAMTIDGSYNFVFSGATTSDNFPLSGNANQTSRVGQEEAYVAVVSEDGSFLNYSTYLGGDDEDYGLGIKVDSQGNIIVAGTTESLDFPTVNAYQPAHAGGTMDCFIAKVKPDGSLAFSTYFGGTAVDRTWELVLDSQDSIIMAGRTTSADYPTEDAYQDQNNGIFDAVVSKLSADGQTLLKSTYLGGSYSDLGEGVAIDALDHIVVSGSSMSDDFPVTAGAYQPEISGGYDVWVSHIAFDPAPVTTTTTANTTTSTTTTSTGNEGGLPDSMLLLGIGGAIAVVLVIAVVVKLKR